MDAESALHHSLTLAQPILSHYGYSAVFIAILLEGFGVPVPGQTILMAGSILAARGDLSITAVLALAFLADLFGNAIGYGLGRWGGRLVLRKAGVNEARIRKMENLFNRYGGWVIFFGRFLEGLRQFAGIVAGGLQMSWWKFFLFNLSGAVAWTAVWGLGVYLLDKRVKAVFALFHAVEPYVIGASLIGLILLVLYLRQGRRHPMPAGPSS